MSALPRQPLLSIAGLVRTVTVVGLGLVLAGGLTSTASASILWNFEDQPISTNPTSVASITDTQGGVTLTVSKPDGSNLQIWDLSVFLGPPSWGMRSIGNFETNTNPILFNLSSAVHGFSLQTGDFDADDDSPVTIRAFSGPNGTGTLLGTASAPYPAGNTILNGRDILTLSVGSAGIESVLYSSGDNQAFPGSMYIDNVMANTVPEPSTLAIASVAGLMGLGFMLRRRRVS
jgi:hypothetical protein